MANKTGTSFSQGIKVKDISVLYESAYDPRTANDPGPQTILKLNGK